jgi:hypothetical protein
MKPSVLVAGLVMASVTECGGKLLTTDSDGAVTTTYNDPSDQSRWVATYPPQVSGLPAHSAMTSNGGTFDGRYIYLAPWRNWDPIRRFDTTQDLSSVDSWKAHLIDGAGDGTPPAFSGAAFDGRYVYFAPGKSGDKHVYRLDSLAPFDAPTSWASFDVTQLGAPWFYQVIFDGRYLTLVGDRLARYDTQAPFAAVESWTTFDVSTLFSAPPTPQTTFTQGVFDGRYLYLSSMHQLIRYDTTAPIATAASWELTSPEFTTCAVGGCNLPIFDGRYVYVATAAPERGLLRHDAQAVFSDSSSWAMLNLESELPDPAMLWATNFDGRYVYVIAEVCEHQDGQAGCGPHDLVLRCDAQASFDVSSCSSVDTQTLKDIQIAGIKTSVFDGRFMYFMGQLPIIVRFDAKSPPSMPQLPAFHGSFF